MRATYNGHNGELTIEQCTLLRFMENGKVRKFCQQMVVQFTNQAHRTTVTSTNTPGRVLAAIVVVDHDGVEDATETRVDSDLPRLDDVRRTGGLRRVGCGLPKRSRPLCGRGGLILKWGRGNA